MADVQGLPEGTGVPTALLRDDERKKHRTLSPSDAVHSCSPSRQSRDVGNVPHHHHWR